MRAALAALLVCALAAPAFACDEGPYTPMLSDWEALLEAGCDLDAAHVLTPIEARALRNVPYAQAGYVFKSPELTKLYDLEDWYTPKPGAKATIKDPKAGACVKKLKALEAKLKASVPIKKAFVRKFMQHPSAVHNLRGMTSLLPKGIGAVRHRKDKTSETWELIGADDKRNVLQLICDAKSCSVNAPG